MSKGSWQEFHDPLTKDKSLDHLSQDITSLENISVIKTKAPRGGKILTVISGLQINQEGQKKLLKRLKTHCGTGGSFKNKKIYLQGDQINKVMAFLEINSFL